MTLLALIVYSQACSKSWWIAIQTRATPGVYAIDRSSRVAIGARVCMPIAPPSCALSTFDVTDSTLTPSSAETADATASPWAVSRTYT